MRRKGFDIEENQAEDDGHTIADMSDVPRGTWSGGWRPAAPGNRSHPAAQSAQRDDSRPMADRPSPQTSRPWEDHSLTGKERFMFILGTLKATMLIGLAYLVGLGLLIGLMVLVWSH